MDLIAILISYIQHYLYWPTNPLSPSTLHDGSHLFPNNLSHYNFMLYIFIARYLCPLPPTAPIFLAAFIVDFFPLNGRHFTRIRWNLVDLIAKDFENFIQISLICIFNLEFSFQFIIPFIHWLTGCFCFSNICFVLFHQGSGAIGLQAYFWVLYSIPLVSMCFCAHIMLFLLLWLCSIVWYQVLW